MIFNRHKVTCRACANLVPAGETLCCETCRQFWEQNYGEEVEAGRETVFDPGRTSNLNAVERGWRIPLQNLA